MVGTPIGTAPVMNWLSARTPFEDSVSRRRDSPQPSSKMRGFQPVCYVVLLMLLSTSMDLCDDAMGFTETGRPTSEVRLQSTTATISSPCIGRTIKGHLVRKANRGER